MRLGRQSWDPIHTPINNQPRNLKAIRLLYHSLHSLIHRSSTPGRRGCSMFPSCLKRPTHKLRSKNIRPLQKNIFFWYKLLSSLQVTIIREQVCLDLFQFFAGDNHTKQIKISFQSHVKREAACSHLHRLERDGRMWIVKCSLASKAPCIMIFFKNRWWISIHQVIVFVNCVAIQNQHTQQSSCILIQITSP